MLDKRISMVPVESIIEEFDKENQQVKYCMFTTGLCFMNDLLYLLKLPNYWNYLSEPVSALLHELYLNPDDEVDHPS